LNHDDFRRMRRKSYLSILYCRNFNSTKRAATREDALSWVVVTREFECFAGLGVRMTKERWKAVEEHGSTPKKGRERARAAHRGMVMEIAHRGRLRAYMSEREVNNKTTEDTHGPGARHRKSLAVPDEHP
jgi:hypothetical protein